MKFIPEEKTIKVLLSAGKVYNIPRFQREYSWDKSNYKEFFDDMVNNLTIDNMEIKYNPYFIGTMLFIGTISDNPSVPIEVVDGQQRLTTITILFSALSDAFKNEGQNILSEQIFKYIVTKDDDGDIIKILQSKTSYPFFVYYIQDREKSIQSDEASTEEEICIKDTYDYFTQQLKLNSLKRILKKRYGSNIVNSLEYIDILKALRDQVLLSTFISISVTDKEQASKIFSILNSKGKRLVDIDLIKNQLFDVLKEGTLGIYAEETWKDIRNILNSGDDIIGVATFYRHYWASKYSRVGANQLYNKFNINIKKSENTYKEFLSDLLKNAEFYKQITSPSRDDYDNRKEYYWLVQSLKTLNDFNIVQSRIALLALYDAREREVISMKIFKNAITFMENFHFAFNALCSMRASNIEQIYSKFARELRKCIDKASSNEIIEKLLFNPIRKLFPSYTNFRDNFKKLQFSKRDLPNNMNIKTKYVINKLNLFYNQKEIFEDDGSIEHIVPEMSSDIAYNIGNLILLEQKLNNDADNLNYQEKIIIYKKSNYKWIQKFLDKYHEFREKEIEKRAENLSILYYTKILELNIKDDIIKNFDDII